MSETPSTVADLLDRVEQRLRRHDLHYGHGTDNPRDESAYLVLGALDLAFDLSEADLRRPVEPARAERVLRLAAERIEQRRPVAYLINRAWFCGLPFYVDERVLIPRSPLAELIEERFTPWVREAGVGRILDIGTGSGCIAVASALAFPGARVDAVDCDADALAVARLNVARHELEDSIDLFEADLFPDGGPRYDLIVANPPYVSADELADLPAEYRHEPGARALAAGEDGLDVVRRILARAGRHLNEDGVLVVEVGHSREALEAAFPSLGFTWLEFERGGEGVFVLSAGQLR